VDHLPGPADVLLIIEVAHSSISFDREVKLTLYARHDIPEVWLLDLAGGELAVYREPVDGQYRVMRKPSASESISPLLVPDVDLRLEVGKSWSVPF
jgi:Uma2 family endonuclease